MSEKFDSLFDYGDEEISSKKGNGKRKWKKVKCQLVEYRNLPGYLKDNEYIHGYYRAEWPLAQLFLSIFRIHNETLNVWTHLIGFFLFLFLTIYTATRVPAVVDLNSLQKFPDMFRIADFHKIQLYLSSCLPSLPIITDLQKLKSSLHSVDFLASVSNWNILDLLHKCLPDRLTKIHQSSDSILGGVNEDILRMIAPLILEPITRWPFFFFMGGAMFCLLASSICHLLSCHSERLSYFFDYAGIAALIATSFYPPVYYSFMCIPFFCYLYLGFITVLGVVTIIFSLLSVFQKPELRSFRASLFLGMGLSGVAPILHKLILFRNQPEAVQTTGYEILMGMLYGFGALIYATRIPERWKPGNFDIAGNSHQLFHILVVAGAYTHYQAGLLYLRWRDMNGCSS
ncbi:hypothetical protein K2173_008012 [Erythroxylum novogranatense]|uniref:Heptahelical transmembrane protein 4-like n=1 Tax=Erythroxylum novogranatense TaxID=1862640 RepID=A0AAV8T8L6_9ROSI|nr:hypothetical protein K2173_008012 [Erythroxylum novogranatense]